MVRRRYQKTRCKKLEARQWGGSWDDRYTTTLESLRANQHFADLGKRVFLVRAKRPKKKGRINMRI